MTCATTTCCPDLSWSRITDDEIGGDGYGPPVHLRFDQQDAGRPFVREPRVHLPSAVPEPQCGMREQGEPIASWIELPCQATQQILVPGEQ